MKLGALLDIVRSEIDDVAQPYLWSDDELIEHADDAQIEAARRGRLLVDSTTTAICQIALVAATAAYALDSRVIRINRAKLSTEDRPLRFCMMRDLDASVPGWEAWSDIPSLIVPDYETDKILLVGKPIVDATLNLTVVRLPLATLNDMDQSLELRAEHQRNLRHWIMHRAYLKRDAETYDPKKALESLALFEREFGKPQPAYDELWAQQYYSGDAWNGRY